MHYMVDSFLYMMSPAALGWSLLGVAMGVIFGAIPGLGGGMLMALMLPATFVMPDVEAQVFLIGIYVGGVSGGLVSGVLLGVPGAPSAIMTTIDGSAMARKGLAARALSLGIVSSFIGGMISWVILSLLALPMARVASQLQSFDYFALVLLGIVMIAFLASGSPAKALISGLFGILVATVGFDPISASSRFTFGLPALSNGFDILPVLIGTFAVRSVLTDLANPKSTQQNQLDASLRDVLREGGRAFRYPGNLVRSGLIGSWIGLLPGIGANVGALMSYTAAQTFSKKREEFGHGSEEAIVASETGNNATVGGALIPMIALGIPGSGQDVILMAALILHSIQPGPLLAIEHPDIFYGVITSYAFANIFMLAVMLLLLRFLAKVIKTPPGILAPVVLMFCVVGVAANHNNLGDAWVMFGFGIVGYVMSWLRFPLAPFIIGFVLGPLAEERLRSALMSTGGDFAPLLGRPIGMSLIIIAVVVALWPVASALIRKGRKA
ncbi:tripartite tricarboxylate transporter permease [Martelella sp. FLE1502]